MKLSVFRSSLVATLSSLLGLSLAPTPAAAQVETPNLALYAPPPGVAASTQYSVQVLVNGVWTSSYVNIDFARTAGSGSGDEAGKTFSWTTFETDAPVAVRVRRLEGGFNTATLRPSRYGITGTKVGADTVEFTIQPGQKVSVEFDTEIKNPAYTGAPYGIPIVKDAMMVFADPRKLTSDIATVPASDIFTVTPGNYRTLETVTGATGVTAGKSTLGDAGGKRVVVFGPGVYDIGYWQVPNNIDQIHLEGGALVYGALDVIPQGRQPFYDAATINQVYRDGWFQETLRSSFKLTGHGILSATKLPWHLKKDFSYTSNDDWWAHVKLAQFAVANITVRDVTLASSPHWVLSWINDDDERTKGTLDNFKMVGAWTYNNDGLPIPAGTTSSITNAFIHADDDAFKLYNSGGMIDNCVVWQSNNGAVFQFGWFPKTVSNVIVSDIDVIHFENWYGVNQTNRAVFNYANAGGNGTISNVAFNNINVEGQILRLFGFNTVGSAQIIRDLSFINLKVPGGMGAGQIGAPGRNYFIGNITNFTFDAFNFGGSLVTNAEQAQFDFSGGAGAGFTFGNLGHPLASAGPDVAITLPVSSATLTGSASDPGGSIASYLWTQTSGPSTATLSGASTSTLTASALVAGSYAFRLTVTDNEGNTATDDAIVTVAPEPPPTAPFANAGADKAITLPTASVTLNGSATDPNNNVTSYAWTQVSGPATATLAGANTATLTASNLVVGSYVFRLTVTDSTALSGTDTVTVTVAPEPAPVPPTANAGADKSIVLPVSSVTLNGTGTDTDGTIAGYAWTQLSGPTAATLTNAATANLTAANLAQGTYVFRLTVTDSSGLTGSDDVSVTVFPVGTSLGSSILWTRGAGNSNIALGANWQGGVAPGPLDIAVLRAPTVTDNNYNVNANTLTWGAIQITSAQTGFWNFSSTVTSGQATGTLIFNGQDIGSYPHAFVVNTSGQGGGLRSNVTLNGGGTFILVHNSGSGLEIDGRVRQTNGVASLIADGGGLAGIGQARIHIRGNNTPDPVYGLTGNITVRNGANLRIEDSFDLSSTGGTITVDATSRWNLGPIATYKVSGLTVAGRVIAPGTYNQAAFTALGLGAYFENTGGTIIVTGIAPTITSQPTAAAGVYAGSASFSVTAAGTAPFTYQWRKNGTPLTGATAATLTLSPLVLGDAGNYDVVVTNAAGSVTSNPAALTVARATASLILDQLDQTHDGQPKPVSVTTAPAGLPVIVTYNGSTTAPSAVGSYAVVATVNSPNYVGSLGGTLVIVDRTPPVLTLPANLTLEATGPDGATATYAATATDLVDGTLPVTLTPASGTTFALGTTTVQAVATDAAGNTVTGSFTVTVQDTTAPVITVPAAITVDAATALGATVDFAATASDLVSGAVAVVLSPASDSSFAVGTTTVTATATDAAGNTAAQTFTVTVRAPARAVVNQLTSLNGTINGSVQQLTGANITLNGGGALTGELLVVGTPTVRLNGTPTLGGTTDTTGNAAPTNYTVTLNGGSTLGRLIRRFDATALPTVAAPASPTGTRSVNLNQASDAVGTWATVKNLTLNGNVPAVTAPAGAYGNFTVNGNNTLILGVAGATTPAVYDFQSLTLNGNSTVQVVGPVIITLAGNLNLNGGLGNAAHPEWLDLRIANGGLTLNGGAAVEGYVSAPTGTVTVNSNSHLTGGLSADRLTVNGNGVITLLNR